MKLGRTKWNKFRVCANLLEILSEATQYACESDVI